MKELKIGELNRMYTNAEDADREAFAEFRSNILLIEGSHYNKKATRLYSRLRDNNNFTENQRLRLTKNHMHRVYRNYVGNILCYAPGVAVSPKQDLDMQSQKDAELNTLVWEDAKYRYRMNEMTRRECQDFVGIGEVACKVFFDPNRGDFLGYKPKMASESGGDYALDTDGEPEADEGQPVFSGDFVFERIHGFNLLRAPGAKSMQDSPYLIVRKMVDSAHLKSLFDGDEEKLKFIQGGKDDTYVVFDTDKGEYTKTKDQTLVKEYYWKPCYDYPEGYYAITTTDGILAEGTLPYGIFPIIWQGFDEYPTTPRGRSIIKQLRPFQAELNRAASAMATHQVTLGDDKIVYQGGSKLSPGSLLPGVRGITFNGTIPPTVLPGRDGGQYMPYLEATTAELYQVAEMAEENAPSPVGAQADPYSMLYSSMKQQRKYSQYSEKFEQYKVDQCELYLQLAKRYMSDEMLTAAIGKVEQINIPEFRKTTKLCYEIKLEPRSDTLETQLGKQLSMQHILQYVGPSLGKDDIGKLIRNMPFSNMEESSRDLTIDYDMTMNDFLAMERGETPQVNAADNHQYAVKKVSSRMKEPDFRYLAPQIQQAYQVYNQKHEQFLTKQAQDLQAAEAGFIPTGGALIAADLYVPNPQDPSKAAKRIRVPYQALDWLVHKLETQGMGLDQIEKMNPSTVSDMVAGMHQQPKPAAPPSPMPQQSAAGGAGPASPLGVS